MECPVCKSRAVIYRLDKKTHRPVYSDAKVLAECLECGEVFIAVDTAMDGSLGAPEHRRNLRIILSVVGSTVCVLLAFFDLFIGIGIPWYYALSFGLGIALLKPIEAVLFRTLALGRSLGDYLPEMPKDAIASMLILLSLPAIIGLAALIRWLWL